MYLHMFFFLNKTYLLIVNLVWSWTYITSSISQWWTVIIYDVTVLYYRYSDKDTSVVWSLNSFYGMWLSVIISADITSQPTGNAAASFVVTSKLTFVVRLVRQCVLLQNKIQIHYYLGHSININKVEHNNRIEQIMS